MNNKGVTLIELLVATAVVGIVALMISLLMTSGTRFFRTESYEVYLQNDALIVENQLTDSIIEGRKFFYNENDIVAGKRAVTFATGSDEYAKCFIWVNDLSDDDYGKLFVYEAKKYFEAAENPGAITFSKGELLCENVTSFLIKAKVLGEDKTLSFADTASDIDAVKVSVILSKGGSMTEKSFEVNPRNTYTSFNMETE